MNSLENNIKPDTIPTGLYNIGNTCFANSVIQWLLHTPEMYKFLWGLRVEESEEGESEDEDSSSQENNSDGNKSGERGYSLYGNDDDSPTYCCCLWGIIEIMEEMNEKDNVNPLGLKDIIRKIFGEGVRIGRQQDAHEFLIMLLHSFVDSECYKDAIQEIKGDRSRLKELEHLKLKFLGSFTSTITCQKWRKHNRNIQEFLDINLVSIFKKIPFTYYPQLFNLD